MATASTTAPTSPLTARWMTITLTVAWLVVGATAMAAIGSALDDHARAAITIVAALGWPLFGAVLIAILVPSPIALTFVRMVAPLAIGADALALAAGASTWLAITALASATAFSVVVFSANVGEGMVQASAYGHERRLPLRPPAMIVGPTVVLWLIGATSLLAGAALTANRRLLSGLPLLAAGAVFGWWLARSTHRFSRRWLVLVPSGLVVHDGVVLGETLMTTTRKVTSAQLAPADTGAADLSGPASGHALEVTFNDAITVLRAPTRATPQGSAIHATAILIAPTRPGRALRAIADHGIAVG